MQHNGSWDDTDTIRTRYDNGMVRYDSDSDSDNNSDTTRYDTMPRETIRYDADTIWIRCGYGATRYDTLVRDSDDSPPPDRVRETIKCMSNLNF